MIQWNTPYGYDRSQVEFDRQTGIFMMIVKGFIGLLVYAPMIGIGYLITKQFVTSDASFWKWAVWIALFAFIQYSLVTGLKMWMQRLKMKGNAGWIVLFLFLVAYCCGLNLMIVYQPFLSHIRALFHGEQSKTITWILLGVYTVFIYRQYHFFQTER